MLLFCVSRDGEWEVFGFLYCWTREVVWRRLFGLVDVVMTENMNGSVWHKPRLRKPPHPQDLKLIWKDIIYKLAVWSSSCIHLRHVAHWRFELNCSNSQKYFVHVLKFTHISIGVVVITKMTSNFHFWVNSAFIPLFTALLSTISHNICAEYQQH